MELLSDISRKGGVMERAKIQIYVAVVMIVALLFTPVGNYGISYAKSEGKVNISYVENYMTRFDNYVTVSGTKFMDGDKELKFVSLNYPQATSDTEWEQRNAIKTIKTMGGNVTRSYTIPVTNGSNADRAYVTGVDDSGNLTFNEDALNNLDMLLAICNEQGIRLIIPLVDHWHWVGGIDGYVWLSGEADGNPSNSAFQEWAWKFYTSEKCLDYFEQMINHLLNRTNSVTGVKYKDDPAILCWETANEAGANQTNQQKYDNELSKWTINVVDYIKSIDTNHLVLDGRMSTTEQSRDASNPADILGAHYYEGNYATRCADDTKAAHAAGKPFILGEFGAKVKAEPCIDVFQAGLENETNGIMMWSLRAHKDGFGYYFHDEDGYWAAYHWPGFESGNYYGEKEILRAIYAYAQIANGAASDYEEAKNIPIPAPETDEAPLLYEDSFANGSVGDIKWRGVVGGAWYEIQRAEGTVTTADDDSVWTTIADEYDNVYDSGRNWEDKSHDCIAGYHDETAIDGKTYSYRLRACNESGKGLWSNIVTVTNVQHVVTDDLDLIAVSSNDANPTEIRRTYSSEHSTNIEYSSSSIVNKSSTEGYIEYKSIIPVKSVEVQTIKETDEEYKPVIYVSSDGVNYSLVSQDHKGGTKEYTADNLDKDDPCSYYTRIYIPGESRCKVDSITIQYVNDGSSYRGESDGAVVKTNVMIQDRTFGRDGAEPLYTYKNDNMILYKTGDDINAYRVIAYAVNASRPKVEYSYDGVTYVEAPMMAEYSEYGKNKLVYGDLNVSESIRAIRVQLDDTIINDVTLTSVELSSGNKSIPLSDKAPANTFEDGEYYFGESTNLEAAYTISRQDNTIIYEKDMENADFSSYDSVYAWVKGDGSGNVIKLEIVDGNGNTWTSPDYKMDTKGSGSRMIKFLLSDFKSNADTAINMASIQKFRFVIVTDSNDSGDAEDMASIRLDADNSYSGNYCVALEYDKQDNKIVYVDSVYAAASTKVDDFEGYSGSSNLLNSAYTRNTNGGQFNISLDSEHKSEGAYGMRVDYDYSGKGYAGVTKKMDLLNLSGYDGFMMYIESDGSGNDIKIQVETDVSTFAYTGYLTGKGPMTFYLPFSAIKECEWAGSGHILDSSSNLKSVSIYTDQIGADHTSGTFYVDDLKGANYVEELESQTKVSIDDISNNIITDYPYTITGTADYVDYVSVNIAGTIMNVPVINGKWSCDITEDMGLYNTDDLKVKAGFYYPDGSTIAETSEVVLQLNVDGNDAPKEPQKDLIWSWDFGTNGTEGWTFNGFSPWVENNNLVAWSQDGYNATFSYNVNDIPNGIYTMENDIKVKSNMNNAYMALSDGNTEVKSLSIDTEDTLVLEMPLDKTFEVTDHKISVIYYANAPADANGVTFAVGNIKLYALEYTNNDSTSDSSGAESSSDINPGEAGSDGSDISGNDAGDNDTDISGNDVADNSTSDKKKQDGKANDKSKTKKQHDTTNSNSDTNTDIASGTNNDSSEDNAVLGVSRNNSSDIGDSSANSNSSDNNNTKVTDKDYKGRNISRINKIDETTDVAKSDIGKSSADDINEFDIEEMNNADESSNASTDITSDKSNTDTYENNEEDIDYNEDPGTKSISVKTLIASGFLLLLLIVGTIICINIKRQKELE